MAQKDKDDLADALKRLAHGDARDDSDDVAPSESAPVDIPAPASGRPAQPPRVARAAEVPKPKVPRSGKARPTAPAHLPAPVQARQPAHQPPSQATVDAAPSDDISSSLANVIDDSELSVTFEAAMTGPRISRGPRGPSRSLKLRRTMIPILLTLGICLPLIAAWWFHLDADAPLKETGLKLPVTLLILGAVMLVLAAVNMLSVRRERLAR